ncbi:hypothetical protein SC1083_1848 [Aggregatibacter actinomycetemcomitans serotype e str. SC1083]|uniref:Uncharacterized protein n=1 Tax=Aggregatibacter actinomycetemcomitans serotype e str. SC1083 TaxID=907488 RepID=G4AAH5_AGGAC|nr:hypothetical protein SC1083_1848 [Aggregatibacter actinomycetemcomitans serotype e str. SC1083]
MIAGLKHTAASTTIQSALRIISRSLTKNNLPISPTKILILSMRQNNTPVSFIDHLNIHIGDLLAGL